MSSTGKGLQKATDNNVTYLVIKHHSICRESKTKLPGFTAVEVNNPKTGETVTKFIEQYKSVEGLICKIEWYDTEERYENRFFGWKIHLDANGTPCVLDLPFDSRGSNRFMKVAENIEYGYPVEFRAWHDKKTDSTAIYIGQDGHAVPQKYTRDNPGDCPAPTQNAVTKKWGFDKQKEFLHFQMTNLVIPAVEAIDNKMPIADAPVGSLADRAVAELDGHTRGTFDDDDIPF